jgi:RNA-directed DNA polymerase
VHHALVPAFERGFIADSYACRRGRGTHRAIARARYYLRRHQYFLKTDIVQFFPNVVHAVMRA